MPSWEQMQVHHLVWQHDLEDRTTSTPAQRKLLSFFSKQGGRLLDASFLEVFHAGPTGRWLWRTRTVERLYISSDLGMTWDPPGGTAGFGWGGLNYCDLKWWKEVRWMLLFYISQCEASKMCWFDISIETQLPVILIPSRPYTCTTVPWTNGPDPVSLGEVDHTWII